MARILWNPLLATSATHESISRGDVSFSVSWRPYSDAITMSSSNDIGDVGFAWLQRP